ncbi:unnamed protein product [Cylicostephanus goldi]|uniref:Uncharacterized protein n=1 Tax=Cylicostephanus goldi TaxID=71465 RepID=A0A3P6QUL7_CYLGO|nr:unnamed protein product [Cylicostephanus goldi]
MDTCFAVLDSEPPIFCMSSFGPESGATGMRHPAVPLKMGGCNIFSTLARQRIQLTAFSYETKIYKDSEDGDRLVNDDRAPGDNEREQERDLNWR